MQTTYLAKPSLAFQGMEADVGYNDRQSRVAAAALHVGVLVLFGPHGPVPPAAGQCQEITDALADLTGLDWGISLYDNTRMPYVADANGKAMYSLGDAVQVLTRGRVWVYTEAATAITDPVFVRVTAAGADVKGQFRPGAAANFIAAPNCRWKTATSGAGLIELEIR